MNMKKYSKIAAVFTAIIGLVVIILGCVLMGNQTEYAVDTSSFRYSATNYSVSSASFGGDFYTYMYKASDVIVDELNDLNSAISTVVKAQNAAVEAAAIQVEATNALINTVTKTGGMVVLSLGLGIFAWGIRNVQIAFTEEEEAVEEQPEEV